MAGAKGYADHVSTPYFDPKDRFVTWIDMKDAASLQDETYLVLCMSMLLVKFIEHCIQVRRVWIDIDNVCCNEATFVLENIDFRFVGSQNVVCRGSGIHTVFQRPDVVIDETARLYLHIEPACLAIDLSVSCTVSLAFRRLGQDFSPFRELVPASMPLAGGAAASAPDPLAEMLYWQKRALFTVPAGAEASEVNAWMGRTIDEPLASWLSLDLATRECWRDYFNKNERESPLSPCLRSP